MSHLAYFKAAYRASQNALVMGVSIVLVVYAAACGGDGTSPGTTRAVASVVVVPERHTLDVGGTHSYAARVLDAQGHEITGTTIAWSSSDATVATVAANGIVTALRAGSTSITARA